MDNPRRFWKPSRAARINIRSYRRPLRSCHHRRGSAARRVRFEDVRHRPLSDFAEQVRVRDDDLGGGLFTQGGVEAVVERLAAERNVEKRGAAAVFEHAELCDNKFARVAHQQRHRLARPHADRAEPRREAIGELIGFLVRHRPQTRPRLGHLDKRPGAALRSGLGPLVGEAPMRLGSVAAELLDSEEQQRQVQHAAHVCNDEPQPAPKRAKRREHRHDDRARAERDGLAYAREERGHGRAARDDQ
mmetsp:Transcript_20041/g.69014  ORF Transcript_20041/g.69014 Transcript_20041/m.69014 type:complete len:246 (+) Transcript_20041:496-1233(+)